MMTRCFVEPLESRIAPAFGAVFELSSLDGSNGFTINGVAAGDTAGRGVSDAGDVNGDGIDDVIIGARFADPHGTDSGAAYVVFGKKSGFGASLDLSTLDGSNGFKLSGVAAGDNTGDSVSGAGDINGDGFDDLIVGAFLADPNGTNSGASYVVFGKASGFAANLDLATVDGSNGFTIKGTGTPNLFGSSVSSAGDVNGDGFADLIIGARSSAPALEDARGASYVIFGKAGGFTASLDLFSLDGITGFRIDGAELYDHSGYSVDTAGDFNGDGFEDIIIGAALARPNGFRSGASYIIFGKANGFASAFSLSSLNGRDGFKLSGEAPYDSVGHAVSSAGDVNGDGYDDVIIGAPPAERNSFRAGASYVVFGSATPFGANLELSSLNGANGFKLSGVEADDYCGRSVSTAGDLNGDGFADVIISAPRADANGSNSGASYVVFGKSNGFAANVNLSSLDGSTGFRLNGVATNDQVSLVSTAGDVNGDGIADLIIGAGGADPGGLQSAGTSYVVYGQGKGLPSVRIGDASLKEGDTGTSGLTFQVTLSAASAQAVAVDFSTLAGTAIPGSDFTPSASGTLAFAPGEVMKTITVNVLGDALYEANETFSIVLSNPSGASLGGATGLGTILNDDTAPVLNIAADTVPEGNVGTSNLTFKVSLSAVSGLPVTVSYRAADGTASPGGDYKTLLPGTLTFAPGEATKTLTIDVIGDTLYEANETFSVFLSNPSGASLGGATGLGTILNDDTAPVLNIAGDTVPEGNVGTSSLTFNVSLSEASGLPVTVSYRAADGTASAGGDYTTLLPRTLSFAPGEITKTLTVDVLGDIAIEDHESFSLILSSPTGATIGSGTAMGMILNDDTAIRISDASATEGNSGATLCSFVASLDKASALPVTVNYSTVDRTAAVGSDYNASPPNSQLTFFPGEISKMITVEVLGDTAVESDETFSVVLSGATNAPIADGTGVATIRDDDAPARPLLRIDDASLLEGHSGARTVTFSVSLSAAYPLPVTVEFASSNGTATAGVDYTAVAAASITFAPGETTKNITISVLGDTAVEPRETFSVALSNAVNAVIDDDRAVATILDDDVTLISPRKATYTDRDGDLVTIKVSKGALKVEDFTIVPGDAGAELVLVDFSGQPEFSGANLSVKAVSPKSTAGNGLADVGYINATGVDLGEVTVSGDLSRIDCGDGNPSKSALKTLYAGSLGARSTSMHLPSDSTPLHSDISGDLNRLKVNGTVSGGIALAIGGRLGNATIRGGVDTATISALGLLNATKHSEAIAIGSLTVGGNIANAQILAGYDRAGAPLNPDASIGRIFVAGNWIATSAAAGVADPTGDGFGQDDALFSGDTTPTLLARIASLTVGGTASGSDEIGQHFGITAQQLGKVSINRSKLALTAAPDRILLDTAGNNLSVIDFA